MSVSLATIDIGSAIGNLNTDRVSNTNTGGIVITNSKTITPVAGVSYSFDTKYLCIGSMHRNIIPITCTVSILKGISIPVISTVMPLVVITFINFVGRGENYEIINRAGIPDIITAYISPGGIITIVVTGDMNSPLIGHQVSRTKNSFHSRRVSVNSSIERIESSFDGGHCRRGTHIRCRSPVFIENVPRGS